MFRNPWLEPDRKVTSFITDGPPAEAGFTAKYITHWSHIKTMEWFSSLDEV
jgi:hypothetical protein